MPYSKIKYSKGTTTLTRVEDRSASDVVEQTLTSHDDPRPEFVNALQSLTSWVVRICDLPIDYANDMRITGVSLSLGEYGGCVVTALKKVSGANSPVVINTPHVPEQPTSDAGPCLPPSTVALLEKLEEEAEKFWKGERAQAEMFEEKSASEHPAAELIMDDEYQNRARENLIDNLERHEARATIRVNGGPAVDMNDTAAVEEALQPLVKELVGLRSPYSEGVQ